VLSQTLKHHTIITVGCHSIVLRYLQHKGKITENINNGGESLPLRARWCYHTGSMALHGAAAW